VEFSPTLGYVPQSLHRTADFREQTAKRARNNYIAVRAVHALNLAEMRGALLESSDRKCLNPGSGNGLLRRSLVARSHDWSDPGGEAHLTRRNVGHTPCLHSPLIEQPDYVGTNRSVISGKIVMTKLLSGRASGTPKM
jgi:hypothetical protein